MIEATTQDAADTTSQAASYTYYAGEGASLDSPSDGDRTPRADWRALLALPVGLLRFMSQRDGLALNLRDFPLTEVARNNAGSIDLTALITLACKRASKEPEDHPELLALLQAELARVTEKKQYCSGHDLAKAFSLVAKRRWAAKAGHDVIERSARAAIGRDAFEQTSIYRDCMRWADSEGAAVWKHALTPSQKSHTE